jgi:glucose/arabinose dehydrogenase
MSPGLGASEIAAWQRALPTGSARADAPSSGGVSIETQLVVSGLADPVKVTHAGDGSGRLFILEQEGVIRIFSNGSLLPSPFLDISTRVLCCSERGLLGIAFSPDYDVDGFFFVNYTDNNGDTVISRFSVSATNPNRALANSEVILKAIDQPFANHNGGDLAFGPDGMLYAGVGDGGGIGDPGNRAQNLMLLLGKLLRLDVDNPPTYIPADNPFVLDPNALDEIWSYGLRNPWRIGFDRATGDLIVADVGQGTREEVDFQAPTSNGGENWGWKVLEGTFCHSDSPPGSCDDFLNGGSELPILEYSHTGGRCSITGGYRYRGSDFPDLDGVYFYGDFCTGEIWGAVEVSPGIWSAGDPLLDTAMNISSFGEGEAGELYVVDLNGSIHQIVSTAGGGVPCADVQRLVARCNTPGGTNRIQARAILTDGSHDGQTVTIGVDGSPNVVTVSGSRASFQLLGATSGMHTISLDDPASCVADVVVNCP